MTSTDGSTTGDSGGTAGPGGRGTRESLQSGRAGPSWWFWLLPALTFVVGAVLTGTVLSVSDSDDPAAAPADASPRAGPSGAPGQRADLTVVVPASCLEALDSSEQAVGLVREGLTAVTGVDPAGLRRVVDQLQDVQARVAAQTQNCREAAADQVPQ